MYKSIISPGNFLIFLFLIYNPLYSIYSLRVDYEAIAHHITYKVADQLETENQLHLIGTGGGMTNNINMMAMSFDYMKETPLTNARKLIVNALQTYLSAINTSKEVRPFLKTYPFTPEMIEIRIFFSKPNRQTVANGQICVASSINGTITYYLDDPNDKYKYITLHKETNEEALQIINNEKLAQPLPSNGNS